MFDSRLVLNKNILEIIEENFKGKVFQTKIRRNISIAEAPTQNQDIFQYAPSSSGAKDYLALCKEIEKAHS